jgi:hypothetical protein
MSPSLLRMSAPLAALMALAACGGGDSAAVVAVDSIKLTGTAMGQTPLAGATLDVKCAGGSVSAIANASGMYTVNIDRATFPCVVRATSADKTQVLHTLAAGSGSGTQTANVSPYTELMVAKASGGVPANVYSTGPGAAVSATRLADARSAIASALAPLGIDLASDNPITDTDAASTARLAKVAALESGLAVGKTTLAELAETLVLTTGGTTTRAVAAALTAPPVANCQAARNVVYRVVTSNGTSRLASPDFATNVLSDTERLTLSPTQPCEFSVAAGNVATRGQVASSGWLVTALPAASGKDATLTVAFPEQTLTLADLKGTWNTVEIERDGTQAPSNAYAVLEIDDKGRVKASDCEGLAACVAGDTLTLTANTNGGYTLASVSPAAPVTLQLYAYKARDGRKAIAVVGAGMLALAAPQTPLTLPAVGNQNQSLDAVLSWNGSLLNATVSDGGSRVTAVDTAARRYTREHGNGRIDEIVLDTPRAGMRVRPPGEFQGSPFAGLIQLPLVAGVTAYGGLGSPRFGVSVTR